MARAEVTAAEVATAAAVAAAIASVLAKKPRPSTATVAMMVSLHDIVLFLTLESDLFHTSH
jgi:hypothetical protein